VAAVVAVLMVVPEVAEVNFASIRLRALLQVQTRLYLSEQAAPEVVGRSEEQRVKQVPTQLFRVQGSHTQLKPVLVVLAGQTLLLLPVELVELAELAVMVAQAAAVPVTVQHRTQLRP
jgi:hypothetical protein